MEISPMLLEEIEYSDGVFDKYKDWYFQEKHNGDRVILQINNGEVVSLRNRRQNPIIHLFPDIKSLKFDGVSTAILDGELCVMDKGKSVFYGGINQRDKKLYAENLEKFPAVFVAFDILYLNGEGLVNLPYSKRIEKLQSFKENSNFVLVKNIPNPKEYWASVKLENREGFVIKNPNARYELGVRSKNYLKLKNYKQVNVVVEKTEINKAGIKIYGSCVVDGVKIDVESQIGGNGVSIKIGDTVPVVYLDIVGNKMIQPHKVKGWLTGE